MNDFEGLIPSDYGFKSQRKSAPMAPPKPKTNANTHFPTSKPNNSPIFDDHDTFSRPNRNSSPNDFSNLGGLNDVFSANRSKSTASTNSSSVNFDNDFGSDSGPGLSSLPVFDKPIYDDEDSGSTKYDDIFGSSTSAKKKGDAFDDLLGGIGSKETQSARSKGAQKAAPGFDELLSGFGRGSNSSSSRYSSEAYKKTSQGLNDPFVVLGSNSPSVASSFANFNDPLEEIGNVNNSYKKKADNTSSRGVFGDIDPLDSLGKSVPTFSADRNRRQKDENSLKTGERAFERQSFANGDVSKKSSVTSPDYRGSSKKIPVNNHRNSPQSVFEMPSVSSDSHRSVRSASPHGYTSSNFRESNSYGHVPSDENIGNGGFNDIWLTVSEIPLFTQPTAAPPPSRPPPPRPARFSKAESRSFPASNAQKKGSEYSSAGGSMPYIQSQKSESARPGDSFHSSIDELEDFSTGRFGSNTYGSSDVPACEDLETNSVAATAMKEAMDKAEAKFRQAAVSRGRESARASSSREAVQDAQEKKFKEHQERLEHERLQREMEEEERRRREEEERKRAEREREEKEREKRKIERERELARQAVERAAREARERAATEARARAERTAVQKAQAEARERAERAAVQRVQAEARERAAAGAKERAEKAAAEARERARAEAREKETCERAAATAAKASQQSGENDLESFFGTGSRASSAPRPSSTSSDSSTYFQSKPAAGTARTSINPSSNNMKKASSSTNIVEDLSSIFGGPPSSGEFQAVEGESEERRRARLERHQRTQERAAKALAEKNARDLEAQREQAERHRIAETLDADIKRWATGKEGNLRALLATLHYVLWPESGWQPVSLTDLINGAAVKKVYRKATLCIHPDKVQQKGATLQQKYIAEKVFDLLKEAWNKFNSEELF